MNQYPLLTVVPPAHYRCQRDAAMEDVQRAGERQRGEEAAVGLPPDCHATSIYEVQGVAEVPDTKVICLDGQNIFER